MGVGKTAVALDINGVISVQLQNRKPYTSSPDLYYRNVKYKNSIQNGRITITIATTKKILVLV